MNTIYLITGASGHLGNVVVRKLLKANKDVRGIVYSNKDNLPKKLKVFVGDVRDKKSLIPAFTNLNNKKLIVIHCAGIVSIASKYDENIYNTNVVGTKNIIELCLENNVSKLIYVSSVHAIYEKPKGKIISETKIFDHNKVVGLYAKTKAMATKLVLDATKNNLNATIVFPSGIIGPYDFRESHTTNLILNYFKSKIVFTIKGGYDFVDVRDVANGIISAIDKGEVGEGYILSNKYYSIKEIYAILDNITNIKKVKINISRTLLKLMTPIIEIYYRISNKKPIFTSYSIYTLNTNAIFSNRKTQEDLDYNVRNIKETLKDTFNWLKSVNKI